MANGSRPPRPSVLPRELDLLDAAWAEEPPTVVYPADGLTREDDEVEDRVTAIPELPGDEFARRLMAAAVEAVPDSSPPQPTDRDRATRPERPITSTVSNAEFGTAPRRIRTPVGFPRIELDEDELPERRDRKTPDGLGFRGPSSLPTAPPPNSGLELAVDAEWDISELRGLNLPSDLPIETVPVTLRPPRSATPRSRAAQEFLIPSYNSAPPSNAGPVAEMKDRYAMGDFSGALEMAEQILQKEPEHQAALGLAQKCRDVLLDMYMSRLPPLDEAPRVIMNAGQLRWLSLDHKSGFLLSLIDGMTSLEELLDVSGMSRIDAMRLLLELLDKRVIAVH